MAIAKKAKTAGEYLRSLRLRQLKIQGEVADACGKTVSYWSALENNKKNVPPAVLDFAVSYFDLDDDEAGELKTLALQAKKIQKVDVTSVGDEAKDLAFAFAKHLKNLDKEQIASIQRILSNSDDEGN